MITVRSIIRGVLAFETALIVGYGTMVGHALAATVPGHGSAGAAFGFMVSLGLWSMLVVKAVDFHNYDS